MAYSKMWDLYVSTLTRTQWKSWSKLWSYPNLTIATLSCQVQPNMSLISFREYKTWPVEWLRIHECITYKLASFMFKINKKEVPKYLCDLVISNSAAKCQLRSASTSPLKPIFCKSTLSMNFSFASVGRRTWNGLPSDIRNESDKETFKKKLKSHLFQLSYG